MLPSRPELQKERGSPFTLSRKKNLLRFKRESTHSNGLPGSCNPNFQTVSFPRRRESSTKDWAPAFAGVTRVLTWVREGKVMGCVLGW